MEEDSKAPEGPINLGLTDLLEGAQETSIEPPFEAILEEVQAVSQAASTYQELWDRAAYNELISATENSEDVNDNPVLRKIWWIRVQVAHGELPKQVLCASLEECLSPDKVDNMPLSLVESTSLELAEKLEEAKEEGLSIAILERCFEVAPSSSVGVMLLRLIQKELAELPKRVTFHNPTEMKKRLHLLDLKRSLDEFFKHNTDGFAFGGEKAQVETDSSTIPLSIPVAKNVSSEPRSLLGPLLAILCLVFGWYVWRQRFDTEGMEEIAGNFTMHQDAKEEMMKPEISRIQDVSQLAALMYDVEKSDAERAKQDTQILPAPNSTSIQQTQPQTPPLALKQKEAIDTSGPIETDRIRSIIDGREGSKYDDGPPVRFPRDDRELSRAPIVRDEREKDRDRQFDSSRAQSWQGGERYEVMINTSVMDGPSFHAHEVSELFVGDRVLVEARVGRWLRLRSVKGKSGYILAQDAEKLYD